MTHCHVKHIGSFIIGAKREVYAWENKSLPHPNTLYHVPCLIYKLTSSIHATAWLGTVYFIVTLVILHGVLWCNMWHTRYWISGGDCTQCPTAICASLFCQVAQSNTQTEIVLQKRFDSLYLKLSQNMTNVQLVECRCAELEILLSCILIWFMVTIITDGNIIGIDCLCICCYIFIWNEMLCIIIKEHFPKRLLTISQVMF